MQARQIKEISFTAPLEDPLETQALVAENEAAKWRLIVLPGTPCRMQLFYRFLRVAPKALDVVVVARPGFGKGHDGPVLDFKEQAKTVKPFLREKKTIVLGVSYGGALALTAALENPDDVCGVVTVAALVTEPFDYARALADMGGYPWVRPLVPQRLHTVRAEVEGRRAQIEPLWERLTDLSVPVEVVHGDFDGLVSLKDAEKLRDLIAKQTGRKPGFDKVPGGTHYLELQYPRRLYSAVERVMAQAALSAKD